MELFLRIDKDKTENIMTTSAPKTKETISNSTDHLRAISIGKYNFGTMDNFYLVEQEDIIKEVVTLERRIGRKTIGYFRSKRKSKFYASLRISLRRQRRSCEQKGKTPSHFHCDCPVLARVRLATLALDCGKKCGSERLLSLGRLRTFVTSRIIKWSTTKVRTIFLSAKITTEVNLNDKLYNGPKLQDDLAQIWLK